MNVLSMFRKVFAAKSPRRTSRRDGRPVEALEDRTLLSNLNLTAAQQLIFGGGAENNNVNISFVAGNYRFEDLSGTAINSLGLIAGLDTNPAANIVEFPVAGLNINQIIFNGNAGADTVSVNSIRGTDGFDVRASAGFDTVNINTDIGAGGGAVTNVVLRGEAVNIDGDITVAAPADVRLEGAVNLVSDTTINAPGAQAIIVAATVDGPGGLTVFGLNTEFQQDIGGTTPIAHLTAEGPKLVLQDVTVVGNMKVKADNFVLTPPLTTWTSTGGGTFQFSYFTPNQDLVLPQDNIAVLGFGTVILGDADMRSITVDGNFFVPANLTFIARTVTLNKSVNTAGNVLTIQANTVNFNTKVLGGGPLTIQFLSSELPLNINGQIGGIGWSDLDVIVLQGTAPVTFNGAFGSHVGNLTVLGPGNIVFTSPEAVTAQGDVILQTNGTVTLPAGIQAKTGGIFIFGDVQLTGTGTFLAGAGRPVDILGAVDAGGSSMFFRGVGGAIATVFILGDVSDANLFRVDSAGANTAVNVDLAGVSAADIFINAININLRGDLISTGNISLTGSTNTTTDLTIQNGGLATSLLALNGPVTGLGTSLVINGGAGKVLLGGVMTGLLNLDIIGGGSNVITQNITIAGAMNYTNAGKLLNKAVITTNGTFNLTGTPYVNQGTVV